MTWLVWRQYRAQGAFTPPGQAWVLAQGAVSKTGRVVPTGWGDLYPALPASCWPRR